jgi:hypothetical protein
MTSEVGAAVDIGRSVAYRQKTAWRAKRQGVRLIGANRGAVRIPRRCGGLAVDSPLATLAAIALAQRYG